MNLLGGAKAILPYRALQRDLRPGHTTRDCAHNTLLVHEKLETDVKTADLACKQIQTLLCCVITRTDPVGEYNNVYLHTKTAEDHESGNAFQLLTSQCQDVKYETEPSSA